MLRSFTVAATLLMVSGIVTPSRANELSFSIREGRVTLLADGVTVRQILAEWARIGQTRIVNGERVSGPPVSLRLVDVPERQALETVLRSVSGYLAAPRMVAVTAASQFDRILILPTSTPPPAGAGGPGPRPGRMAQPFNPPPMETDPAEETEVQEDQEQADPTTPFIPQRPGEMEGPIPQQPGFIRRGDGIVQPVYQAPMPNQQEQTPTGPQPFPGAPTTSPRPGEIVAPPAQQAQPPAPGVYPGRPVPQQQPPPD
jgi:hypothetical protein